MINDLDVAIAITERFQESQVTVSRDVLMEVICKLTESGNGQAHLNLRQASHRYPFMHRVSWNGITFVHYSSACISDHAASVLCST